MYPHNGVVEVYHDRWSESVVPTRKLTRDSEEYATFDSAQNIERAKELVQLEAGLRTRKQVYVGLR